MRNLFSHAAHRGVVCNIIHPEDLHYATDGDVLGTVERLKAFKATCSNADFKVREQALGFTYHKHAMLFDSTLTRLMRPVTQYVHDWMHGIFAGGVFNITMYLLREDLSTVGFPDIWRQLGAYIDVWSWPLQTKFKPERDQPFLDTRVTSHKRSESFKVPASQGLCLLPVLGHFVQKVVKPTGACTAACNVFLQLCDIVDAMQLAPLQLTDPRYLEALCRSFLRQCELAGWQEVPSGHR